MAPIGPPAAKAGPVGGHEGDAGAGGAHLLECGRRAEGACELVQGALTWAARWHPHLRAFDVRCVLNQRLTARAGTRTCEPLMSDDR
eukprot:118232-Pyramimonas_sp.AAC.3